MKRPLAPDEATTSTAAEHGHAAAASVPSGGALSERRARSWFRYAFNAFNWVCAIIVLCCLYGLSLGPVMGYYKRHPIAMKPGIRLYILKDTPGSGIEHSRRVHFPKWVSHVYAPVFRLKRSALGENGLGSLYRRYLFWSIDQKAQCLKNLRRLDEAKRKWALETQKMEGAPPFADHIIDYLPKRSMSQCPSGGDYKINPVGTKPECSFHGDDF